MVDELTASRVGRTPRIQRKRLGNSWFSGKEAKKESFFRIRLHYHISWCAEHVGEGKAKMKWNQNDVEYDLYRCPQKS